MNNTVSSSVFAAQEQCLPADADDEEDEVHGCAPDIVTSKISNAIVQMFQSHFASLKRDRESRREQLSLRCVASSANDDGGGSAGHNDTSSNCDMCAVLKHEDDKFEGDGVLRTLHALLGRIDERGYSRSTQQMRFHDAFIRACSRVLFRADWASNRPTIMKANDWSKCPSEILISTPRRFGKVCTRFVFQPPLPPLPTRPPLHSHASHHLSSSLLTSECTLNTTRTPVQLTF